IKSLSLVRFLRPGAWHGGFRQNQSRPSPPLSGDVAMEPRYRDAIHNASAELSHALLEDIPALLAQGLRPAPLVRDPLRAVGLAIDGMIRPQPHPLVMPGGFR